MVFAAGAILWGRWQGDETADPVSRFVLPVPESRMHQVKPVARPTRVVTSIVVSLESTPTPLMWDGMPHPHQIPDGENPVRRYYEEFWPQETLPQGAPSPGEGEAAMARYRETYGAKHRRATVPVAETE